MTSPAEGLSPVHGNIRRLHPDKTDPQLMRILLDRLLNNSDPTGFVICCLIVQTMTSTTEKLIFRVMLNWTGRDVKSEIKRLYSVPIDCQVIIVNDRTVADDEPLSGYDFRPKEQIVYLFLRKRPSRITNSNIRVKDIIPNAGLDDCDDVTIEPNLDAAYNIDTPQFVTSSKHSELLPNSTRDSGFYSSPPSDVTTDGAPNHGGGEQKKPKKRRVRKR